MENNNCLVCGEDKKTNKKYCSIECRYKDSHFKTYHWNSKENLEKHPELIEKAENASKKAGEVLRKKYENGEIKVWNDGLTKETNDTLKKMSEDRMGDKNPIHKILGDKDKVKKWTDNVSKALKGKKYGPNEERFGEEKAKQMSDKMSNSAKKREIHGHSGHKHTEETKQKIRESNARRLANKTIKYELTEPMKIFLKLLQKLKIDGFINEYLFDYYSIDFAYPKLKLAVEIDGDFWHCNPNTRHAEPKHEIQKKNIANDKRKETFLKNKEWSILRFWESDLHNNIEFVERTLIQRINELSKIK